MLTCLVKLLFALWHFMTILCLYTMICHDVTVVLSCSVIKQTFFFFCFCFIFLGLDVIFVLYKWWAALDKLTQKSFYIPGNTIEGQVEALPSKRLLPNSLQESTNRINPENIQMGRQVKIGSRDLCWFGQKLWQLQVDYYTGMKET